MRNTNDVVEKLRQLLKSSRYTSNFENGKVIYNGVEFELPKVQNTKHTNNVKVK